MVTEDMAKFTYFLSRQGEWEGKQLLRKEWFERACRKQIETEGDSEGHVKDWAQGYGYQCWMCRYPGPSAQMVRTVSSALCSRISI